MSADEIRRAAALMRERAGAAYDWTVDANNLVAIPFLKWDVDNPPSRYYQRTYETTAYDDATTVHLGAWHPAVALAVADWLDGVAHYAEARADDEWHDLDGDPIAPEDTHAIGSALAVATAYIGEQP